MTGCLRSRLAALIAVAEERVLNVEVPLICSDLHRFAHAAAREMDGRRHVREFDESLQVLERAVTPSAIEIVDERRSANRRKHSCVAAESYVALGVARIQREFPRCGREQPASEAARNVNPLADDVGARAAPQTQGLRIAPKLDANFLEDRLGVGLDHFDRFGAEQLDYGEFAADIRVLGGLCAGSRQASVAAAARGA